LDKILGVYGGPIEQGRSERKRRQEKKRTSVRKTGNTERRKKGRKEKKDMRRREEESQQIRLEKSGEKFGYAQTVYRGRSINKKPGISWRPHKVKIVLNGEKWDS